MPPVIRQSADLTAGHSCFPPTIYVQGSGNVFINGLPVVRKSDIIKVHCCPLGPCHLGQSVAISSVYVNGLDITKAGDAISCGDVSMGGSGNVSVG